MQALVFVIMSIVNVILSYFFSTKWRALGAGLAISISYFLWDVGVNIIYIKALKIDVLIIFKEC